MNYESLHQQHNVESLFGRYITLDHLEPLLSKYPNEIIGYSVLENPIYKLQFGTGKTKIFIWSQMHGNESTTTKAVFDFINLLHSNTDFGNKLLQEFTFCILPMVNPDGAKLYTRENANEIDLNRDSQILSQPESQLLRKTFDIFQPDYCYNLHDQRTIFGAGNSGKPATVSFLSPSFNENRDMNETRAISINVIVAMNTTLQHHIPDQVGRFDDSFNINCIGDTFQSLNVPTILIEAGHFQSDYQREQTRKYIFIALISGFKHIYENDVVRNEIDVYLQIPQNNVCFYDFVCRNVKINYDSCKKIINFAVQYKEILHNNQINFEAYICQVDDLENYIGHVDFDAKEALYEDDIDDFPKINKKANFRLGERLIFVKGLLKV
jgi:hypothetical protein